MNWRLIRYIDALAGIPLVKALHIARFAGFRGRGPGERGRRRILVVKFWGIGNLFMMLPALNAIRNKYPESEMDLLTLRSNREAAELIGLFGIIHTVDTGKTGDFIASTLATLHEMRKRTYDLVVDFEQFARFSALLSELSGGRETIGFNTAGQRRHHLYTHAVPYDNTIHVTQSYGSLAQAAGAGPQTAKARERIFPSSGDWVRSRTSILKELGIAGKKVIVLHVGTSDNFPERRWPASSYAALADLLTVRKDVSVVLTGLADEIPIADAILASVLRPEQIVNTVGGMDFTMFFSLIRSSDMVVSADTAAVHIASAVGTPVVGLFGPNTPVLYGPWGKNGMAVYKKLSCSPCITNFNAKIHICRHPAGKGACMTMISADEVFDAVDASCFDEAAAAISEDTGGDPCSR